MTIADLSRAELAVLVSDIDDRIEVLERSDRTWALWTIPSTVAVAVAMYVVFAVADIAVAGTWILANVLLGLGVLAGGRMFIGHKRRALENERASLYALAGADEHDSLPESAEQHLLESGENDGGTQDLRRGS